MVDSTSIFRTQSNIYDETFFKETFITPLNTKIIFFLDVSKVELMNFF